MSKTTTAIKWGSLTLVAGALGYLAVQSHQAINNPESVAASLPTPYNVGQPAGRNGSGQYAADIYSGIQDIFKNLIPGYNPQGPQAPEDTKKKGPGIFDKIIPQYSAPAPKEDEKIIQPSGLADRLKKGEERNEKTRYSNLKPLLEDAISSSINYFTDDELYKKMGPSLTIDDSLDNYLSLWVNKSITNPAPKDKETLNKLILALEAMSPYTKDDKAKAKLNYVIRKLKAAAQ